MILSYTHLLQPKQLTNDIVNYCERKIQLITIYYNRWIVEYKQKEPDDIDWLSNDIIRYANEYQATMVGVGGLIKKFKRVYLLRDMNLQYVNEYVSCYIQTGNSSNQINTLLGVLTPSERDEFLYTVCPFDMRDP